MGAGDYWRYGIKIDWDDSLKNPAFEAGFLDYPKTQL